MDLVQKQPSTLPLFLFSVFLPFFSFFFFFSFFLFSFFFSFFLSYIHYPSSFTISFSLNRIARYFNGGVTFSSLQVLLFCTLPSFPTYIHSATFFCACHSSRAFCLLRLPPQQGSATASTSSWCYYCLVVCH